MLRLQSNHTSSKPSQALISQGIDSIIYFEGNFNGQTAKLVTRPDMDSGWFEDETYTFTAKAAKAVYLPKGIEFRIEWSGAPSGVSVTFGGTNVPYSV